MPAGASRLGLAGAAEGGEEGGEGGAPPEARAPLSRPGGPGGGGDDARPPPPRPPTSAWPAARVRAKGPPADPRASVPSPDLASDVFSLRVKLEETGELFRVANCRNDMTVRELKEELDLMVGIPFNLQRLHFLDQGGSCPTPSRTPLLPWVPKKHLTTQGDRVNPSHLEPHLEGPPGAPNSKHSGISFDPKCKGGPETFQDCT